MSGYHGIPYTACTMVLAGYHGTRGVRAVVVLSPAGDFLDTPKKFLDTKGILEGRSLRRISIAAGRCVGSWSLSIGHKQQSPGRSEVIGHKQST